LWEAEGEVFGEFGFGSSFSSLSISFSLSLLNPRRGLRSIRQPPKQRNAHSNSNNPVNEKHPLKPDEAPGAVHFLEPRRDEADDGRGELCGCVVLADTFPCAGGRVEEREVVGHAGPHSGDYDAEEEAEEAGCFC
jgi:hypothetical protein